MKTLNSLQINVNEWGTTGPKIILVHGSAQGSSVGGDQHFANQKQLADKGFDLLVPDRPGHGKSPAIGKPDDGEDDGAWIVDLLGDGAHLVGHSFGTLGALNAAFRRPALVKSLTLIEPAMFPVALDDWRVRKFLARFIFSQIFSFSPEAKMNSTLKVMHIPREIAGARDASEIPAMAKGFATLKTPSKETLIKELNVVRENKIPLLVVTGGWNPAFTAVGDRVASMGGGQHVIVKSPHHFPQAVSNEFNDRLAAFVKQNSARN